MLSMYSCQYKLLALPRLSYSREVERALKRLLAAGNHGNTRLRQEFLYELILPSRSGGR